MNWIWIQAVSIIIIINIRPLTKSIDVKIVGICSPRSPWCPSCRWRCPRPRCGPRCAGRRCGRSSSIVLACTLVVLKSQQSAEIACRYNCVFVFIDLVFTSEVEMLWRCGPAHGALHPQCWLLPPGFGLNMIRGLDKGLGLRFSLSRLIRHYDRLPPISHMLNWRDCYECRML